MRLRLEKDIQKKLIDKYRSENKLTWQKFGDEFNVKSHVLIDLKYERNLIPSEIFYKIGGDPSFVLELKEEGWGKSKGGHNSKGSTKDILYPEKDESLAELIGIILGDGHVGIYKNYRGQRCYLTKIAGHSQKDKNYLLNYIKPLLEELFGIKVGVYFFKDSKCIHIYKSSKKLVEFFLRLGLVPGNKVKNNVGIPEWIWKNERCLKSCLRGAS